MTVAARGGEQPVHLTVELLLCAPGPVFFVVDLEKRVLPPPAERANAWTPVFEEEDVEAVLASGLELLPKTWCRP